MLRQATAGCIALTAMRPGIPGAWTDPLDGQQNFSREKRGYDFEGEGYAME